MKITAVATEIKEEDDICMLRISFKGEGIFRQSTEMPAQEWYEIIHIRHEYNKLKDAYFVLVDQLSKLREQKNEPAKSD